MDQLSSPFIANNFPLFFSRTRYTFPTSPLPSSRIFWKLLGPTSTCKKRHAYEQRHMSNERNRRLTCRTLIEWLEYVLRNAIFPGPFADALVLVIRSLVLTAELLLLARAGRMGRPLEDVDDTVSSELPSWSDCGTEGIISPGASRPFFVVAPEAAEREPRVKRPLALGADATRRMNLVALAPIALGDNGPERDADGGVCCAKDICDALAVNGGTLDLPFRGLSDLDFDCDRVLSCSLTVSPPSPKSAGK